MITAQAHPNIALIKYWGKQDKPGNIPATPNLSITLSELTTTTHVSEHEQDEVWLNAEQVHDNKIDRFLAAVRNQHPLGPVKIDSHNNFPTGAGLASSASGFAALTLALNEHLGLGLNEEYMSEWARLGSASAARSLFGGYVALVPPLWRAQQFAEAAHWPLNIVVGITSTEAKTISSTKGMNLSRDNSPFYKQWVRSSGDDFAEATDAVNNRDFDKLAHVAELSCLKMHSVMLTTTPTLAYWNPATMAAMQLVRDLRSSGTAAFYTIDAGPQIKVVCLPEHTDTVTHALNQLPGIISTTTCALGGGAQLVN